MDIVCIRGAGDRRGDDIVEPLLSTVEAGLSRGRAELDEGAFSDESSLTTLVMDLRLGNVVEVDDSVIGRWRGKLTSLSHSVQIDEQGNLSGESRFTLRKPR
jgi:hypothetical protein